MEFGEERNNGRRSASVTRDSRTAHIELAQRRLESALATPNSPSSPWSARSLGMGLAVGSPTTTTGASHSPANFGRGLRSVSFSSEPDHRFPGARRTDHPTFPSTFEDNESEASVDDMYFEPSPRRHSPTALLPRSGGLYAAIGANGIPVPSPDPSGTRSRSQSLATLGRRPLTNFPPSPLPAPGSQGLPQSWADSRFGIPAPIHNSHNFRQVPRQDLSNISPFVRDVGQIFQEDPREFWPGEETGPGSGATSRRHSVSVVQPRGRFGPQIDAFAQGRSVISDDDLLGNMLNLDLDDSTPPRTNPARVMPATFNPRGPLSGSGGGGGSGLVSQPSSLPTYPAPLQRHSPVGALGLHEHNSPRASTLDYVPENGTGASSWRQTHNPSPERSAGGGGGGGGYTRPALSQLRTDSLRSSERGFSPSLSPNTQRGYSFQGQQATYERQGSLGLGLTTNTAPGPGPSTTTPSQSHFPGSSPRTASRPFPISPSAMRTSFGPVQPLSPGPGAPAPNHSDSDLGRGLPLSSIPTGAPLYVVEFKAGRTDLFFAPDNLDGESIRRGDLVIVEADRGKDLGKVVNDSISLAEVERFMMDGADDGQGGRKEIMPKRIYGRAGPGDTQLLLSKMQDEVKALQLCQSKIRQKKLPMEVIDAEYQWDRRKLTFYYISDRRIDFRELVRELFRLYKTRIWMSCLQGPTGAEPTS